VAHGICSAVFFLLLGLKKYHFKLSSSVGMLIQRCGDDWVVREELAQLVFDRDEQKEYKVMGPHFGNNHAFHSL